MVEERIGIPSGNEQSSIRDEAFRVRQNGELTRNSYWIIREAQRGKLDPTGITLVTAEQETSEQSNSLATAGGEITQTTLEEIRHSLDELDIGSIAKKTTKTLSNGVMSAAALLTSAGLVREGIRQNGEKVRAAKTVSRVRTEEQLRRAWESIPEQVRDNSLRLINADESRLTNREKLRAVENRFKMSEEYLKESERIERDKNKLELKERQSENSNKRLKNVAKWIPEKISAISKGVAEGLSENSYIGYTTGSGMTAGGGSLAAFKIYDAASKLLEGNLTETPEPFLIGAGLMIVTATGLQTLVETTNKRRVNASENNT